MNDPIRSQLIESRVTITTCDAFELAACLYIRHDCDNPPLAVVINAGAGIRQRFYQSFAQYLARHGVPVLTYDYRGVGASRPTKLRGFPADVEDWGSKDCAAAIQWTKDRFPQSKLAIVAHSIGGLVTGFVTNGPLIDKLVLIGPHTGYWGDYRLRWRSLMFLAWHVAMPFVTRTFGHFPGRSLRLGDDLPAGVAQQWAGRLRANLWWNVRDKSGRPDIYKISRLRAHFATIHARVLAVLVQGDAFATASGARRLLSLFPNAVLSTDVRVAEQARKVKGGHFAFFLPAGAHAWPSVLSWLARPDSRSPVDTSPETNAGNADK